MWDSSKNEWRKICKKAMNPTIRIYNQDNKIMARIEDIKKMKFRHRISSQNISKFLQKECNLSCQWTADKDIVHNEEVIVHIIFKTSSDYQRFVDVFQKYVTN